MSESTGMGGRVSPRMFPLPRTFACGLALGLCMGAPAPLPARSPQAGPPLYTQKGSDPSFKELLEAKKIPVGRNSTEGIKGSETNVNNKLVEKGRNAGNPILQAIAIHTLANSVITRAQFGHMTGKSFDLRIRDNGYDYEVFFDEKPVGKGSYARPTGSTCFRWGMYDKTLKHDALIFVTGAKFN